MVLAMDAKTAACMNFHRSTPLAQAGLMNAEATRQELIAAQ